MDLARNLIGRINVGDSLTRSAAARPDRLAVVDGDRRLTYKDFNAYVNLLAHGLAGLGYERGAALAVASGNSADFLATYYACAKLGVVCVPINLGWRPDEAAYVLGHSRARGIVVETQLLAAMQDAIAKVPEVLDVIVAPGTAQEPQPREPADRAWTTLQSLSAHDNTTETIDAGQLIAALKTRLDGFKMPKSVVFVDLLPKTSTGKIQKNVVRSEYMSHYQDEES